MNLRKICSIVLSTMLVIALVRSAIAQETIQDNTVRINVGTSWGSGAYVGDRLVLSCAHLYDGEATTQTRIWFPDGKQYIGTPLKIDHNWDESVIEISTKPNQMGIPIAANNPKPGDAVYAYGYGGGDTIKQTAGYVQKYLGNSKDPSASDWFALTGSVDNGTSGGPIVNADGYIIGNLWGTDGVRTVGLCAGRTKRFLLPWRDRLSKGQCRNGKCYPNNVQSQPNPVPLGQPSSNLIPLPQPELVPLPPQLQRPLPVPDQTPVINNPLPLSPQPSCNCNSQTINPQDVADILKQDAEFVSNLKGEKGDKGDPGKDGANGKDGTNGKDAELTTEHIAAMTAAILQKLKSDQDFIAAAKGDKGDKGDPGKDGTNGTTPNVPDSTTGWSHLVLVCPKTASYWYRLGYDYKRATDYYNNIHQVEPPTDRNIGPMPLLVAYSDGKPAKSWTGLRDVSQALNYITRGEYDKFLLGTSDDK